MRIFRRYYFARFKTDDSVHWRVVGSYFWTRPTTIIGDLVIQIEDMAKTGVEVIEFKRI